MYRDLPRCFPIYIIINIHIHTHTTNGHRPLSDWESPVDIGHG